MFSCTACLRRAIYSLAADLPAPVFTISYSQSTSQLRTSSIFQSTLLRPSHERTSSSRLRPHTQTRSSTTVQSIRKGHHRRALRKAYAKTPKKKQTFDSQSFSTGERRPTFTTVDRRDARARLNNRNLLDRNFAKDTKNTGTDTTSLEHRQSKDEWRVSNYLRDPLKLAGAVLERLREGDSSGALDLVRASEKVPVGSGKPDEDGHVQRAAMDNVVSWNHLMDWHMYTGDTRGALKVYNELKKRGHKPDAHTYTIMLRGFADPKNIKNPNAVRDAVSVYNSIFATNSQVTPNTIHTNAIVNVCARGRDMDALWAVTGRLPERGPGSPDKWTYTTVLNALRVDATGRAAKVAALDVRGRRNAEEDDGVEVDVRKVFEGAVQDGRRLWEDVVAKWRSGNLLVDEPLVCAMGRLLMVSLEKKDWADVGALVEQTMGIKNLMPTVQRSGSEQPLRRQYDADGDEDDHGSTMTQLIATDSDSSRASTNEFAPILRPSAPSQQQKHPSDHKVAATNTSIYAIPRNNTLSLLVEACTLLKSSPDGKGYWDLLTSSSAADGGFDVQPDAQNLTAYLRLLRLSRSSKLALDLLRGEYSEPVEQDFFKRGTFVIAMSTCVRDKNNPNAFDYASTIVDLMQEKLEPQSVEPRVLGMYVELAVATTPGLESARGSGAVFVPDLRENHLMRMLGRLRPDVVNIKKLMGLKSDSEEFDALPMRVKRKRETRRPVGTVAAGMEDLAGVLRGLIGAYDRVIAVAGDGRDNRGRVRFSGGMGEGRWREYVEEAWAQKRKLSAFLGKMVNDPTSTSRREFPASAQAAQRGAEVEAEAEADGEGEYEISDEEAEKSVPGKRKVYRALQEGVTEYDKLPRQVTRRSERAERELKRVEKVRAQFPRSMLRPLPRREVRVRAGFRERERERDGLRRGRDRGDAGGSGWRGRAARRDGDASEDGGAEGQAYWRGQGEDASERFKRDFVEV